MVTSKISRDSLYRYLKHATRAMHSLSLDGIPDLKKTKGMRARKRPFHGLITLFALVCIKIFIVTENAYPALEN